MKHNWHDLTGHTFGKLTAVASVAPRVYANGWRASLWLCHCECGTEKTVRATDLRRGSATSCGCSHRELARQQSTTHGQTGTPEHHLWTSARDRHRRRGIPFNITLDDIHIPEFCPVLGLRLEPGVGLGGFQDASPSIDRIDPHKGYTPDNIVVMSFRANALKRDATLAELQAVLKYMQDGPPAEAMVQEYTKPQRPDLKGDLTGHRFGRLVVKDIYRHHKNGTSWVCQCDCGNTIVTPASRLALRRTCGCVAQGVGGGTHKETNGAGRGTDRYQLWRGAKKRAKEKAVPFSIDVRGIRIPERCPVLDIPLRPNIGGKTGAPGSPSLDRFDPAKGYIPGNVVVISHRANRLKSDATITEFIKLVQWMSQNLET